MKPFKIFLLFQNDYQSPREQNYENIQRQQQHHQITHVHVIQQPEMHKIMSIGEPLSRETVKYKIPKSTPVQPTSMPPSSTSIPLPQVTTLRRQDSSDSVPALVVDLGSVPTTEDYSYNSNDYQPTMYTAAGLTPETAADIEMVGEDSSLLERYNEENKANENSDGPLLTVNIPLDKSDGEDEEEEDEYLSTNVICEPQQGNTNNSTTEASTPLATALDSNQDEEEPDEEEEDYLASDVMREGPLHTSDPPSEVDIQDGEHIDGYSKFTVCVDTSDSSSTGGGTAVA